MSHHQIDAVLAESGDGLGPAARADLREGLGSLLALVEDAAPTPSPELAALLGLPATDPVDDGTTADVAEGRGVVLPLRRGADLPRERRLTGPRGAVTGAVVLAMATVGATGISAAANSLPAPLQRHVADLSRTYLPFDFPQPRAELDRDRAEGLPGPGGDHRHEGVGPDAVREPTSQGTRHRDRVLRPARSTPDATVSRTPATSRTWTVRRDDGDGRAGSDAAADGSRSSSTGTPPSTAPRSTAKHDEQHGGTRTRTGSSDGTASAGASGPAGASDDGTIGPRATPASPPPVLLAVPRPGRPVPSASAPEVGPREEESAGSGKSLGKGQDKGPAKDRGPAKDKGQAKDEDEAEDEGTGATEVPDVADAVARAADGATGSTGADAGG